MKAYLQRRRACLMAAAVMALAALAQSGPTSSSCLAQLNSAKAVKMTHTYKKVGDLEIKADVFAFDDANERPVVVWIHGGALIMGHRESVPAWLADECAERGYILASIDYRLAPETQLPEIIRDVEDAFAWIAEQGPKLFHADPKRIAVAGGSAGGYLTLTAGFRAKPRPVALVALWGYGDLVGDWYSTPSPHPRHQQPKLSREDAYKQVSGPAVSDARERRGDGGAFYQFCRQTGSWPKAVAGWDPRAEEDKFHPYMPVKNVTPDYPPTLMIHGEDDTDVPHAQSLDMAEALRRAGVEHELISIPDGEHGLAGADPKAIEDAYARAKEFLRRRLAAQ